MFHILLGMKATGTGRSLIKRLLVGYFPTKPTLKSDIAKAINHQFFDPPEFKVCFPPGEFVFFLLSNVDCEFTKLVGGLAYVCMFFECPLLEGMISKSLVQQHHEPAN